MRVTEFPPGDDRRLRIPRDARHDRFARGFTAAQIEDLRRRGVTSPQLERLKAALRVIAYCAEGAPPLPEVRKALKGVEKQTAEAAHTLSALLSAPAHETARTEAKERFLEALRSLYPDQSRPSVGSFFEPYTPGMEFAARLVQIVEDIQRVAQTALDGVPSKATKTPAHWYPIFYIHEALSHEHYTSSPGNREPFPPSASLTSPFRIIVGICYTAAGTKTTDPETAIRDYLKTLGKST